MDSKFVTRKVKKRRNPHPLLDQLEKLYEKQRDNSKTHPYPYDEENVCLVAGMALKQLGSVRGARKRLGE